jgi:iron-sulfur cluster assembly protein
MTDSKKPVSLSATASLEIKKMMAHKNIPVGYGLRVGVRGGGCGVQLILGFDKPKETDIVYSIDGIVIMFEKRHMMYLIGKTVAFYEGNDARGFHFTDTNSAD